MYLPAFLRILVALACLVGPAGCAHRSGPGEPRQEYLLSERPPERGRQCRIADDPPSLPAVDAVVDSAALEGMLRNLRSTRQPIAGYAILSMAFDENGWNAVREIVEHDLPAEVADSLQKLVFEHRRTVAPGKPWGVRLRIDLDETPLFRVGRQEICAPRALSYPSAGSPNNAWDRGSLLITLTHQNSVWAHVLVDAQGRVSTARLEQTGLNARWESFVLGLVQSMHFAPATVDGIPFATWTRVRIPLQLW